MNFTELQNFFKDRPIRFYYGLNQYKGFQIPQVNFADMPFEWKPRRFNWPRHYDERVNIQCLYQWGCKCPLPRKPEYMFTLTYLCRGAEFAGYSHGVYNGDQNPGTFNVWGYDPTKT